MSESLPQAVVIGAGFAGLRTIRGLSGEGIDVVVVDQRNYHTFQPLLYQVATAGLHPQDVGHGVRAIVSRFSRVRYRRGTIIGVDWSQGRVLLADGGAERFDYLVIAAGSETATFGVPGVEEYAFPLKTLADARRLRDHVLLQFERVATDPRLLDHGALTFVIVGGGPTGVELAGALTELIAVLRRDYPEVDVDRSRIVVAERLDHLLPGFASRSRSYTEKSLHARGVEVLLGETITRIGVGHVETLTRTITSRTVVWAAGVRPSSLASRIGVEVTSAGRIVVGPDLRIPGRRNAFAIGDIAAATSERTPLPQIAPVAIQQGSHAAAQIRRMMERKPTEPFSYRDKGMMATIGRNTAVAELRGGIRLRGSIAWVSWLGLHLLYLVGFRNRFSVLLSWVWSYFTYDRGVRLLIDDDGDVPSSSIT